MKLYLMRHGHSPTVTEAGVARDFDRPLSDEGRDAVRRMAEHLLSDGTKPGTVLHSPLLRARQTARIAASVLKPARVAEFEPLSNVLPPDQTWERLKPELEKAGELLAVGHQPQIGEVAAYLTGRVFEFKPGSIVALELGEGKPAALWSLNPQDLPVR